MPDEGRDVPGQRYPRQVGRWRLDNFGAAPRARRTSEHVASTTRRRHDSERTLPSAINGALAALFSCIVGVAAVGALALVGWIAAAGHSSINALLEFVGYAWLAGHLAPVATAAGTLWFPAAPDRRIRGAGLSLQPRRGPSRRDRDPRRSRSSRRRRRLRQRRFAVLVAALTATAAASVPEWAAFLGVAVVVGVGLTIGAASASGLVVGTRLPSWLRADLWAGLQGVVALAGGGALIVVASAVAHIDTLTESFASLQPGLVGTVIPGCCACSTCPRPGLWAAGLASGVPVGLGGDDQLSMFGDTSATLPGLPLFAAVPAAVPGWIPALLLMPIAVGAVVGYLRCATPLPLLTLSSLWFRLRVGLVTGVLAGLAVALTGGELMGRLTGLGPNPLLFAAAVAGLTFLGFELLDLWRHLSARRASPRKAQVAARDLVSADS